MTNCDAQSAPDWDGLRQQMAVVDEWAYFDHAAVAPLPKPSRATVVQWADDFSQHGDVHWSEWAARLERLRQRAAARFGARPQEIALIHSTTEGISLVAEGYPWREGDNVVVFQGEFPSNLYPWMNLASRGVETRWVTTHNERYDLKDVEAVCDARTRIVAVSWVGYATGWRNDIAALAEIAHRHGALLMVDAIQGLGVLPIDVGQLPIDFFAADGHKWMLGPEGAGLLFIRQEHLERLRPLGVGWNSVKHAGQHAKIELDLKQSASRYEGGTPNIVGLSGLESSFELLSRYRLEELADRIFQITDLACARLESLGATIASDRSEAHRSGIVSFTLGELDLRAVRRYCLQQRVALSHRNGRLRISPHAYNTPDDVERLVDVLRAAQRHL